MFKLVRLEWKQVFRDRFIMVFFALGIAYYLYGLDYLSYTEYPLMMAVQQVFIWWALIIGFRKASEKETHSYAEWMEGTKSYYRVITAQALSLFALIGLVFLFVLVSFTVKGVWQNIPSGLLRDGALSVVLHFLLDPLIAASIGLLIGTLIPKLWGIAVGILLTFLMGTIGYEWIGSVALHMPEVLQKMVFLPLQLGAPKFAYRLNTLYGFGVEQTLYVRKIYLLAVIWIGLLAVTKSSDLAKKRKSIAALAVVFALSAGFLFVTDEHIQNESFHDHLYIGNEYLESPARDPGALQEPAFEWKALSLDVDIAGRLAVNGTGTLALLHDTDTLAMNLYHDLRVNSMQIDGNVVPFAQEGDRIEVSLPELRKAGEEFELEFSYRGKTPNDYFAGKSAVYLPGYFTWIPQPARLDLVIDLTDNVTLPIHGQNPVSMKIHYTGKEPCFISADEKGMAGYGTAAVIAGHCSRKTEDGITYGFVDGLSFESVKAYTNRFLPSVKATADLLGTEMIEVRNVIFVPHKGESFGTSEATLRRSGDTLYIDPRSIELAQGKDWTQAQDPELKEYLFVQTVFALSSDSIGFLTKDIEMRWAFFDALVYWQVGITPRRVQHQDSLDFSGSNPMAGDFLRDWYRRMNETDPFSFADLNQLLEQYR